MKCKCSALGSARKWSQAKLTQMYAGVPRHAQTATTSSHHPMARLPRLKLMKHLFRGCDNLKFLFSKISLPCPSAVFLTTILHCLWEPMSRLMLDEGGGVTASIFPRVGSAEQSIDSSPARLFILIAADGRHAAAVLPTFNLTSSLCSQVQKK